VIAIFGPTASGKSAVAEALAELVDGDLVVADSMQLYRGLPILTNQSPARLVGVWNPAHEGSLAEYQRLAHAAIEEIVAAGRTPILVGGSGLYFRAALVDLELPPAVDAGARARWERTYDEDPAAAHGLLRERDPQAADLVHVNDRKRVVRALELAEAGGSLAPGDGRGRLWTDEVRHPTLLVGLDLPAPELERRIAERTRAMFDAGVVEEVRAALAAPLSRTVEQSLGLRAIAELERDDAVEAVELQTRRLAAYQRKWMRRIPGLVTLAADRPPEEIAAEIAALGRPGERLPRDGGVARP
jgi:tRNA dimethylallyltransferase